MVSEIVLLIGKLLIVVLSTISAYFYLDHYFEDQLRGLHVVTSLIFLISMVSAELFNQIFAIAISTILQCYVTDEETFEVICITDTASAGLIIAPVVTIIVPSPEPAMLVQRVITGCLYLLKGKTKMSELNSIPAGRPYL